MNSKLHRALLVAALLVGAALRPAAAESPTLLRAALIVEDASRSMAFYELLGFRVEMDQANPRKAEGNPFPLNAPSSAVRLVIMQSDSGAGGRIGLVEFSRPTPAEARRDPERTGRGDVVLVFDVADADAVHATMQRAGAKIIEPPQVYTSKKTAPDGSPLRGTVFHVRDPDGYLIELLQAPR
jgi:catechol 2,3-dioxygenase-like lactoylglutathione lyase family enzyme